MSRSQSGSVLFYIFICIALFAALSIAVARMMQGGDSVARGDAKRLTGTQMLQYADAVRNAVRAMQIGGVDESSLCFDAPGWGNTNYVFAACSDPANKVFDAEGGAAVWEGVTGDLNDGSAWLFTAVNGVKGAGTTCAGASCADLKMILPNVRLDVCLAVNDQLGITNPNGVPPEDTGYDAPLFTGAYTATATADIGDEADSAALSGKMAGCFKSTTAPTAGTYHFYRVLVAR